jgi:lysozyme
MKTSINGLNIIKEFEGLRLEAYKCPAGILTIGYGHTGLVVAGSKITKEEAERLLVVDVEKFEKKLNDIIIKYSLKLNQNKFDSLISFCYNLGFGNFLMSTLLKKIRVNSNDPTIEKEFQRWNKASGVVLPGLTKRRKKESLLYFGYL